MKTMLFSTEKARSLLTGALLPACAAFFSGTLSSSALGQASVGLVSGNTRDSATGKPVAEAQIDARNLDKGTDRAAVTNTDGVFAFTNLEPGRYEIAATKNGFQKSSARVEVAAQRTVEVELALQADI